MTPLVRRAPVAGIEDVSVFKQDAGVASSSVRRAPVDGEEGDSLLSPMRQAPVAGGERVRPAAAGQRGATQLQVRVIESLEFLR